MDFIWNSNVIKLKGTKKEKITSLILQDNQKKKKLAIEGLFVAIGHSPATNLFKK